MIVSCSFASQESAKSTYSCLAGSSPGIRNACKNWPGCLTDSYLLPLGASICRDGLKAETVYLIKKIMDGVRKL